MPDDLITTNDISCCPQITKDPCCESLRFSYRLRLANRDVPVEYVIEAELERCPGPLALGDIVYSTTLLPGEKVRLYTSTRNNRFTYDSESEVTYRHEQASEETYYMSSMDRFMSDLTVRDQSSGSASSESEFETEGSVSNWAASFFGRPNARVEGEFSGSSTFDFMRELSSHASSSHSRSVSATRAANSIAIGEVQSRTHAEGESESAYEASTRIIENTNRCHAVTYFAYQMMKKQTIRFRILAVRGRVIDPVGDSAVEAVPARPVSAVSVLPSGVLATADNRVNVETAGRTSAAAGRANILAPIGGISGIGAAGNLAAVAQPVRGFSLGGAAVRPQPLTDAQRKAALEAANKELRDANIVTADGKLTAQIKAELEFEITTCLPTQAIVIKGCLDACNTCEDGRQREIKLDLDRKQLENEMLKKQIELLEKSQEYRCCPAGEAEHPEPGAADDD